MSDGDPKFDSPVTRDYAVSASINWKIVSAYNPRENAKVERMAGTLKSIVQKVVIRIKDRDWYEGLKDILEGYPR